MRAGVLTKRGSEEIAALEVKEIITAKHIETKPRMALFDADLADLLKLAYLGQSFSKVFVALDSFSASNIDELKEHARTCDVSPWISEKTLFYTEAIRDGHHEFSSQHLFEDLGKIIRERTQAVVATKDHEVLFLSIVVDDACVLGIDITKADLGKRDYRIFPNQQSLSPLIAYAMLRWAGFDGKKTLVDCFMKSGEIIIETALFALGKSPHFYRKDKFQFLKMPQFQQIDFVKMTEKADGQMKDSKIDVSGYDSNMRNVKAAQKNAKIAGVQKSLWMSRVDVSWLELKQKENAVDCIVTQLPMYTVHADHDKIAKIHDEFFYQAEFVLKKKGVIVVACRTEDGVEDKAEKYKFKPEWKKEVFQGQEKILVWKFGK